jgi:hypothetical protein
VFYFCTEESIQFIGNTGDRFPLLIFASSRAIFASRTFSCHNSPSSGASRTATSSLLIAASPWSIPSNTTVVVTPNIVPNIRENL